MSNIPVLPQEQLSAGLWICRGFGSGQFTVFGARPRILLSPVGVRAIVEKSLIARLSARLAAAPGVELAEALNLDENMVSHLRASLGLGLGHGGARRGERQQPAETAKVRPLSLERIAVLSSGGKPALVIVREGKFALIPNSMVLVEIGAEEALGEYLSEHTIAAAAETCELSPKVIVALRKRYRTV